jgi:hypothetical protein
LETIYDFLLADTSKVLEVIMNKRDGLKISYPSAIVAAIVFIIIFCITSVVSNTISLDAWPSNFIGAMLGALISALITLILLRGQTDIEEKKGKDIRILKKKMKIFRSFINSVWEVWEDQIITIEEFKNLTKQYYQDLMIFLKEESGPKEKSRLKIIGDALTAMGRQIGKETYQDSLELRKSIVTIINTLSADLGLGGKIDTEIMDEHDKIVFPMLFKRTLLSKLNEALNVKDHSSHFKEGKYEAIWYEKRYYEFITFEMKKYHDIKLTLLTGKASEKYIVMNFFADPKIQQLDQFRYTKSKWEIIGGDTNVNVPIPDDKNEDKKPIPDDALNFLNKGAMEIFRTEKRNFPDILSKRVLYHLGEWKLDGLGYIEFFEKYLGREHL